MIFFLRSLLLIFVLVYENKYYLQVHLDNCAYKIIDKQMMGNAGNNFLSLIKISF